MQQTNWYTLLFAFGMSAVVALGLGGIKEAWKDKQAANEAYFNKQQILRSVMAVDKNTKVDDIFANQIKGMMVNSKGEVVSEDLTAALKVEVKKEKKKPVENRQLPVYKYTDSSGDTKYIFPTVGLGLWDAISSYFALESDKNTVAGVSFDHVGETPGLGAKIKDDAGFYTDFEGEKIFDKQGELVGVLVRKGNNDPNNNDKEDHTIDAIAGATITGDGVEAMIKEDMSFYLPFLKQ